MKRKKILSAFIIVLILVIGLGFLWQHQKNLDITSQFRVFSVKELYPSALVEAKKWREDALLYSLYCTVNPPGVSELLRARFSFTSKNVPLRFYVRIEETLSGYDIEAFEFNHVDTQEQQKRRKLLNLDDILLDSPEAFQRIFENGGAELFENFMDPEPDYVSPLMMTLFSNEEFFSGDAFWQLSQAIGESDSSLLDPQLPSVWIIRMNAYNNEISPADVYDFR